MDVKVKFASSKRTLPIIALLVFLASSQFLRRLPSYLAPVTSREKNGLRFALCHKTLFGNIDLEPIAHWAKYHYDLGFDKVFIWYIPDMANRSGFAELESLDYVRMLVNTVGEPRRYKDGYLRMDRKKPGNQLDVEKWCLQVVAADYDFVLNADADEYLYFSQRIGVHEFVEKHGRNNTWWSFGKQMYTMHHRIEANQSLYGGLNKHAFTAGPFCVRRQKRRLFQRGSPYCPYLYSRSKVMVNPAVHDHVNVHGHYLPPDPAHGILHFSTDMAHLKEWPSLFDEGVHPKKIRPSLNFSVREEEEVKIHELKDGHKRNANGTFDMYFDSLLEPWMEYVSERRAAKP